MFEKVIIDFNSEKTIYIEGTDKYMIERGIFSKKSYEEQIMQLKEEVDFLKKKINSLSK